jgi:hypothetical protein
MITNIFNIISNGWSSSSMRASVSKEEKSMHQVKEMGKYQIYGLKYFYHLAKNRIYINLIYNLINSKFTLKNSLANLKHAMVNIEEKKFEKSFLKLEIQLGLNMSPDKIFQRHLHEIVSFYAEIVEEPNYKI